MAGSDPPVSIVICTLYGERLLPACLTALRRLEPDPPHEIIVVDNGSTDRTPEIVRRAFPECRLIQTGRNLGFAGGNNAGITASKGNIIVLLNDDTEVPSDWLRRISAPFAAEPQIGAVGCKLLYPGGKTIQHAGGTMRANGNTSHVGYGEEDRGQFDAPADCDYVTGAALAIRRSALEQVGLLDPGFFPTFFEEIDLEKRMLKAGWKIRCQGDAWLIHHESQSQGVGSASFVFRYTRNRLRYLALHGPPFGWRAAIREEAAFFRGMMRTKRAPAFLRAYCAGIVQWPLWRLDRRRRRTVPRLPPQGANQ